MQRSVPGGCDAAWRTENRAGSGSSTLTGAMISDLHPLVAANVGFAITFGLFVVALLTLFFLTARWAIRHDRAGYAAWRKRQQAAATSDHHSDHNARPRPKPRPRPSRKGTGLPLPTRELVGAPGRQVAGLERRPLARADTPEDGLRPGGRGQPGRGAGRDAGRAGRPGHPRRPGLRRLGRRHQRGGLCREPDARGDRADGRVWRKLNGGDIFPRVRRSMVRGLFFQKRPSVHANTGLRTIIEAGIDFENLEDAAIPVRGGDDVAHRRPRALDRPRHAPSRPSWPRRPSRPCSRR